VILNSRYWGLKGYELLNDYPTMIKEIKCIKVIMTAVADFDKKVNKIIQ